MRRRRGFRSRRKRVRLIISVKINKMKKSRVSLNSTPFVRQYGILDNKWGDLLCQKEYQTNDTHRNSRRR